MSLKDAFKIYLLLLLAVLEINLAVEIPNCNYEDTVNLTKALKFENNSYLYENILITPDLVGTYDYKEIFNGKRIKVKPHLRGCVCQQRNCLRFCCDPTKEFITDSTRQCSQTEVDKQLHYDPCINVTYNNGSLLKTHLTKDFVILQGIPCEGAFFFSYNNWDLYENGSIYNYFYRQSVSKRDYCLTPYEIENQTWNLKPIFCKMPYKLPLLFRINIIALAISVPFIALTICVYIFTPELYNFHGKCLISYLTSLALDNTIFSMVSLPENFFPNPICSGLANIGYFFGISVYFWQNVISFDIWRKFRSTSPKTVDQNKRFLIYSTYAWGVPMCLTFSVMVKQNFDVYDDSEENCWFKSYGSLALLYYISFSSATNLLNTVFFILTVYKIIIIQREIKNVSISDGRNHNLHLNKNNVALFFRICLITGISWLLDIFTYYIEGDYINYIVQFVDALMGILIFICFVLKPNVLKLIKRRLQLIRQERRNLLMEQLQR